MFPFSTKREFRHFHLVVGQRRLRNVQKSVMHVQSCCFANQTYCFFCRSRCRPRRRCLSSLLLLQRRLCGGRPEAVAEVWKIKNAYALVLYHKVVFCKGNGDQASIVAVSLVICTSRVVFVALNIQGLKHKRKTENCLWIKP